MTEHTEADLLKAISEETKEHWQAKHEPLLLSQLGPNLSARNINFREISALPMKKFIEDKMRAEVKILVHPDQIQKIGVVPVEENYDFPPIEPKIPRIKGSDLPLLYDLLRSTSSSSVADRVTGSPSEPTKNEQAIAAIQTLASRDGSSRKFVYRADGASEEKIKAFLKLIDGLTFREIDTISIPLRTLVRMLMA